MLITRTALTTLPQHPRCTDKSWITKQKLSVLVLVRQKSHTRCEYQKNWLEYWRRLLQAALPNQLKIFLRSYIHCTKKSKQSPEFNQDSIALLAEWCRTNWPDIDVKSFALWSEVKKLSFRLSGIFLDVEKSLTYSEFVRDLSKKFILSPSKDSRWH